MTCLIGSWPILKGKAGADQFNGGNGIDKFILKATDPSAKNTITDFEDGTDLIKFKGGLEFADLIFAASNSGVIISWDKGQVVLSDITVSQITEDDFVFA